MSKRAALRLGRYFRNLGHRVALASTALEPHDCGQAAGGYGTMTDTLTTRAQSREEALKSPSVRERDLVELIRKPWRN
jgi:hypothetical protein